MKYQIFLLVFLCVTACKSKLDNQPIYDPAIIAPFITLECKYDDNNDKTSEATVIIVEHVKDIDWFTTDFNKLTRDIIASQIPSALHIKNGKVLVDGTKMDTIDYKYIGTPCYSLSSPKLKLKDDKTYNVDVVLSDGAVYTSTVTTPDDFIKKFKVPKTYTQGSDMPVSWKDGDQYEKLSIDANFRHNIGNSTIISSNSITIDSISKEKGEYIIPASFFRCGGDTVITKLTLTLEADKYGVVNEKFPARSRIVFTSKVERNIEIKTADGKK